MRLTLNAVDLDSSIQCRASIDMAVVSDYAERMEAGDTFPPIEVFGTKSKCWIGDGWHRVFAAKQNGAESIDAHLGPGGRGDALKYALGANALHGHRRSNADKRRCVEIALREFPKLSGRAVAKMCGVSHVFVEGMRPVQVETVTTSDRTGQDGKQYPKKRRAKPAAVEPEDQGEPGEPTEPPQLGPPRNGLDFARMALMDLEQIRADDVQRDAAFECVLAWISDHWKKG